MFLHILEFTNIKFPQERNRRGLSLFGTVEPCPELGPTLQYFNPAGFQHIRYQPQCLPQVKPNLTLFTRTRPEDGCLLAHQDQATGSFAIQRACSETLQGLSKVVFLVHGFRFFDNSLDEYMDMKTEILNHEDIGVVIVDWTTGSNVDINGTVESLIGIGQAVVDPLTSSNTVVTGYRTVSAASRLISGVANLEPYHQAAANTRSMGAALAYVSEHIRATTPTKPLFHCIGHSLGAHVCGFMGKALIRISEAPPLDRITGLDPAGPLFLQSPLAERNFAGSPATHLTADDAILVDTIHTDSTWFGSFEKTGDLDFYVGRSLHNEDKFGYDQEGAVCFAGSHSWSKQIYLSTISKECNQETVCGNIQENRTSGCQNTTGLKFGYNIGAIWNDSNHASVPVSVNNTINCASGKGIKVLGNIRESGTSALGVKGPNLLCSFIKFISKPMRDFAKLTTTIFKSSTERIEALKLEIDGKLADLIMFASELPGNEEKLAETYGELREIDMLYDNQKSILGQLATRMQRKTKSIIRIINDILSPDVTTSGRDIRNIVKQVKILLSYSNVQLPRAETNLEEIAKRYGKLLDKIQAAEANVRKMVELHGSSVRFVENKTLEVRNKMKTKWDVVQVIGSLFSISFGLLYMINTGDVVTGSNFIAGGGIMAYLQKVEEETEAKQLQLLNETMTKLNKILKNISEYSTNLGKANTEISSRLDDIKKRKAVVKRWLEMVDDMWQSYFEDDYNELEHILTNGRRRLGELTETRDDFQKLQDIATEYLDIP